MNLLLSILFLIIGFLGAVAFIYGVIKLFTSNNDYRYNKTYFKKWVNPYRKKDGTFVNGYYRSRRKRKKWF